MPWRFFIAIWIPEKRRSGNIFCGLSPGSWLIKRNTLDWVFIGVRIFPNPSTRWSRLGSRPSAKAEAFPCCYGPGKFLAITSICVRLRMHCIVLVMIFRKGAWRFEGQIKRLFMKSTWQNTQPGVLDGHIFALFGLYDYLRAVSAVREPAGSALARQYFDEGVQGLKALLPEYEMNGWLRFNLCEIGLSQRRSLYDWVYEPDY